MEVLALIPARGGSKGILRKNIKPLAGKPLITWAIAAAKESSLVSRVVVSTEDQEIAEVARAYGAELPFVRPQELAQDLSTTLDVVLHALQYFRTREQYVPDMVLLLPPTAPLVTSSDIEQGIGALMRDKNADSVRPIIESPKHPFKALKIEGTCLKPFYPSEITGFEEPYDMPRQLFPNAYVYSGTFQVIRRRTLEESHSLSGKKMGYILLAADHSINIDTLDDFAYADMLMRRRLSKRGDSK